MDDIAAGTDLAPVLRPRQLPREDLGYRRSPFKRSRGEDVPTLLTGNDIRKQFGESTATIDRFERRMRGSGLLLEAVTVKLSRGRSKSEVRPARAALASHSPLSLGQSNQLKGHRSG